MYIIPLLSQVDLRFFILFVAEGKSVKLLFVLIFVELVGPKRKNNVSGGGICEVTYNSYFMDMKGMCTLFDTPELTL